MTRREVVDGNVVIEVVTPAASVWNFGVADAVEAPAACPAGQVPSAGFDKAAAADLVRGTTATTYEPGAPVRRDQMASFLTNVIEGLVSRGITEP